MRISLSVHVKVIWACVFFHHCAFPEQALFHGEPLASLPDTSYDCALSYSLFFLHLIHQILDSVLLVIKEHHFLSLTQFLLIIYGPCCVGMLAKMTKQIIRTKNMFNGKIQVRLKKSYCTYIQGTSKSLC